MPSGYSSPAFQPCVVERPQTQPAWCSPPTGQSHTAVGRTASGVCMWRKTSASCWTSECECPLGSAKPPPGIWGPLSAGPPCLTVPLHRLRIGTGDVLTFYDGDDLTARVLGQYSGPRGHFKLFTSMADVTIQFQSDPGASVLGYQQGFVIHFFGELAPALPCWGGGRVEATPGADPQPRQVRKAREVRSLSSLI